MEKKSRERLFATLLFVSLLFNVNQCSKSSDFDNEKMENEISEIKLELDLLKKEIEIGKLNNLLSQDEVEPFIEVKEVEVKKPAVSKPVTVDSIIEPIIIEEVDSMIIE